MIQQSTPADPSGTARCVTRGGMPPRLAGAVPAAVVIIIVGAFTTLVALGTAVQVALVGLGSAAALALQVTARLGWTPVAAERA